MSIDANTNVDEAREADASRRMVARIEQVREDLNLSRMAFCRHIGFPYPRYHHITGERQSKPTADLLQAVARHTGVNPSWLLTGEGRPDGGWPASGAGVMGAGATEAAGYVLLPLFGVQGSAGSGQLVEGEEVEDLLAFKRDWIARELRSSPEKLVLIHVQGESMAPTLSPGDVILVEREPGTRPGDGIYVLRMGEALLVKRLQFLPDGVLRVCSDNEAYAPFTTNLREESEGLEIIGRVVWAGRKF